MKCRVAPLMLWLAFVFGATPMSAQAAEEFYSGKQIQLIIGGDVAGAYNTYARLLAQFLGNHISGNPRLIPQNMTGAGGLRAANYLYNVAPRDGTAIAAAFSSTNVAPLTTPGAEFDANKFNWLGSITKELYVGYVLDRAPIKTLEEARTREVILAGSAVGSAGTDMVIIANALFGFKFKLVTGYKGPHEMRLAMERGEADGAFTTSYADLKDSRPDWLRDGKIRILTQFGLEKNPKLADVPLFIEVAKTKEDRQLLELLLARSDTGKPYMAPPGVPAERVAALRRAFDATVMDPKFIEAVEKAHLEVDGPMTGEELSALTARLLETPPSVVKRINAAFEKFQANK
jgi:tripartite-type tricarboxylate transporter receptor subunit TctC